MISTLRQHKQLIAFIALGMVSVSVGAIAVVSYSIVRTSFLRQVQQKVFLQVFEQTAEIDRWLMMKKAQITTIAANPMVRQMDWPQAEAYLMAEVERTGDLFVMQMAFPDGTIYNTKAKGLVKNRNIRDRAFFQQAMRGETNVGDPVIGRTSKRPVINIGTPIYSLTASTQSPIGVFSGTVTVDRVQQIVNRLSYGAGSYAFALSSEGRPIVHPDSQLMGTLEKPAPSFLEAQNQDLRILAQQMMRRERGIMSLHLDDRRYYVAFVPLQEVPWSIALVIPHTTLEKELWLLDVLASILGGLLLVATIVMTRQIQISQRAQNQLELLRDTQQRLQSILDNSPAVIFVVDRQDRYLLVNRAYAKLAERPISDIVGKTISEIWSSDTSQLFQEHCHQVLETNQPLSVEETISLADGVHSFLTIKFPLYDATGSSYAICGISTDMTERIRAEAELQAANLELEKTNAELARATRMKDEFLAMMSHELRTPLNAILGLSEGLQDEVFGTLNARQQRTVETIERSGKHLLELINDILDLAKIESGKLDLQISLVSVKNLCEFSLSFVQQQALKKNIKVSTKIAAAVWQEIAVDERRMRQVLINLLNNAVKFTPEGGSVTLAVSLVPGLPNDDAAVELRFDVQDTGIGITQADLVKLFQPFVQIDSSLSRQHSGTGLGLTLVSRLVELHGGRVTVRSEPGQGSCFTVHLPGNCGAGTVTKQSSDPIESCTVFFPKLPDRIRTTQILSAIGSYGTEATFSSPERKSALSPVILLAEDNEINVDTISNYLNKYGYHLIRAKTGSEAIAMARSQHPDLVLMDIQMPGMDGLEATRLIRSDPELATVPIVALTALAMSGDRERCLSAGADHYLTKPIHLRELVEVIQRMLQKV